MNLAIKTMLYEISGEAHFYQNFLLYTTGYGGMSEIAEGLLTVLATILLKRLLLPQQCKASIRKCE